jgi:hypothetical protein
MELMGRIWSRCLRIAATCHCHSPVLQESFDVLLA